MTKPLIGITPSYSDRTYNGFDGYAKLISLAGGEPVLLPYYFSSPERLDGLVLSGGGDVDPSRGGYSLDCPNVEPSGDLRDEFEFSMCRYCFEHGIPILGICRGHQLLAAALGGTMIGDIPHAGFTEKHTGCKTLEEYHAIYTLEGTLMRRLFGEEKRVWSTHHQAVKEVPQGFVISARSKEGVVEGIEHLTRPALGIQCHPERMDYAPPFEWLVAMATGYQKSR